MNQKKGFRILLATAAMLLLASSALGAAGDLLWEKEFNFPLPPTMFKSITINALSASQTSLIICGNAGSGPSDQIGFIKAFDVTTGNLKWGYELTLGSQTNTFNAITIEGGVALVSGVAYGWINNPPSTLAKGILRACNADTGQFLWETQQDIRVNASTEVPKSYQLLMTAANNRTYLAVTTGNVGFYSCIVRAFQVKNASMAPTSLLLD